ncbi:MAG: DUF4321 domain-containing protein [Clostridia bacterium]|nr:DUF4321 domain-containing protein [Clostridia bacterium]
MEQKKVKKKRKLKPFVVDTAFFVGGLAIGEVVASLVKDIAFLKWLSFEVLYGLQEPLQFNLLLFKFTLGCTIRLSPALILFGLLGLLLSRLMRAASAEKKERSKAYDLHPDKSEHIEDDEDEDEDEDEDSEDEEVVVGDDSQRYDY